MSLLELEHLNTLPKKQKRGQCAETSMEESMPKVYFQLYKILKRLEKHYKDMQDVEFTVENNKLWILQTRSEKEHQNLQSKLLLIWLKKN